MATNRHQSNVILGKLREIGIDDKEILEYILWQYLSGSQALEAVSEMAIEFGLEEEED